MIDNAALQPGTLAFRVVGWSGYRVGWYIGSHRGSHFRLFISTSGVSFQQRE
ncbi:MAG TPA: hypothetical protein VIU43_04685 [Nitrosospira sp.]